ncbi:T-cell differentiation antigen CD6 isoform X4 [Suricata suricatta]|uniref:T-cell differentiation antigen CD6 isoform X4 n=1 Tax=Suricata suricatta TaxID=37032 RepID=UPI0011566615|nr:T-cell differentiation antigen CD6 isoform X4 [Suricata suricatta]
MAPDMWLFAAILGLLTAAVSGHPTPTPSGQLDTSSAESQPLEPGQRLGVRLVNGSSHCSGTVEVWIRKSWEPACGAFWNHDATEAVCRALGCGRAGPTIQPTLPPSELPPGPGAGNTSEAPNATLVLAPAVLCQGAEWLLCHVEEHVCDSAGKPAEVTCAENHAVRLVGGSSPCAGRVEMLEHGQWGSVCDDAWDLEDAQVVCRQLNCGWAVQALPGLHFAPGQGPIHRDEVSCTGTEDFLWDCHGLPGNGYCGHKEDAGVVCSGSRSLLNLSTTEAPASIQPVTVESTVTQQMEAWKPRELILLILCIILGILLLGILISTAFILFKVKGKYALPVVVNAQHPPATTPEAINNYQDVPITISKEEDSQRHRFTEEEAQQNRFQMPPLEEGLEEAHSSQVPPASASAGHYGGSFVTDAPSLGSQHHARSSRESSTSSGEDYCNSPSSRLPRWTPQVFSTERSPFLEQPPNLELAGSQATFSAGPSADDSSSTSSGEWYQNFQQPPQPPETKQFQYPGTPRPQADSIANEDYDDIGGS